MNVDSANFVYKKFIIFYFCPQFKQLIFHNGTSGNEQLFFLNAIPMIDYFLSNSGALLDGFLKHLQVVLFHALEQVQVTLVSLNYQSRNSGVLTLELLRNGDPLGFVRLVFDDEFTGKRHHLRFGE